MLALVLDWSNLGKIPFLQARDSVSRPTGDGLLAVLSCHFFASTGLLQFHRCANKGTSIYTEMNRRAGSMLSQAEVDQQNREVCGCGVCFFRRSTYDSSSTYIVDAYVSTLAVGTGRCYRGTNAAYRSRHDVVFLSMFYGVQGGDC